MRCSPLSRALGIWRYKLFKIFKRKQNKKRSISSDVSDIHTSWRELPGSLCPSVEDLKVEILKLERNVRLYLESRGKLMNKRSSLNEMLGELPNYPSYSDYPEIWAQQIDRLNELKGYRNQIIHHRDCDTLPPVEILYPKFKKANELLTPMRICDSNIDRFSNRGWNELDEFQMIIDDNLYSLKVADINNVIAQLDMHSRGNINFQKGLMVVTKYHDYFYENLTVYIEGYPRFDLTIDETMTLSDYLISALAERMYS
ncbi:hypothetical protein CGT80_18470 [Vibrio cholerae]|nr:hypothetical protein CGT80_18470 [Vibrio cholerae]